MAASPFPAPPTCRCGLYAIGQCVDCQAPICGEHGETYADRFRCKRHSAATRRADQEKQKRRQAKQQRRRAEQDSQRERELITCRGCLANGFLDDEDEQKFETHLANMRALGPFEYTVPGVESTYTEWLCETCREGEFDPHCDACTAPLYGSGAGISNRRLTDDEDEAADHGYTHIWDRAPFEIFVELCPACDKALTEGRLNGAHPHTSYGRSLDDHHEDEGEDEDCYEDEDEDEDYYEDEDEDYYEDEGEDEGEDEEPGFGADDWPDSWDDQDGRTDANQAW